jgi:hypothetical protein
MTQRGVSTDHQRMIAKELAPVSSPSGSLAQGRIFFYFAVGVIRGDL